MRALPLAAVGLVAAFAFAGEARAGSVVIKHPGDHVNYKFELEPHLNLAFFHYNDVGLRKGYRGVGSPEFGAGVRGTFQIADPAFIPKLNNTVGITAGLDLTGCPSYCNDHVRVRTPVGIQWTFHVTREFNAFADLGGLLRISGEGVAPDFFAMAGARYLFTPKLAVTGRVGYPFVSLGISLLF